MSAVSNEIGDAVSEGLGLAGAGTSQDEERTSESLDGFELSRI